LKCNICKTNVRKGGIYKIRYIIYNKQIKKRGTIKKCLIVRKYRIYAFFSIISYSFWHCGQNITILSLNALIAVQTVSHTGHLIGGCMIVIVYLHFTPRRTLREQHRAFFNVVALTTGSGTIPPFLQRS
jgi:hypothetical protein